MHYKLLTITLLSSQLACTSQVDPPKVLVRPFSFIQWNFDQKDIARLYPNNTIKFYISPSGMNANMGKGKYVYGKLTTVTVKDYNWVDYFPSDISFNTIKNYNFIRISSTRKWHNCDLLWVNKSTCQQEYNQLTDIYRNTVNRLNGVLGKQGKPYDLDDIIPGEQMYTWDVQGFEISFSLIVDDSISFLQFFIRES
jgi:hypothetical protein